MEIFIQQLINAISLGGIYALLALGLAVVFSIVSLINFAHGELMTIAGYGLFFAIASSFPLPLAILIAVVLGALAATMTERLAFRPMRKADAGLLLTSFAVSAILRVLFQNGISARAKAVPLPAGLSGTLDLGIARIGVIPLLSIVITILSLVALSLFLKRTTLGTAMRAAADDFQVLRLMGIRANIVIAVASLPHCGSHNVARLIRLWVSCPC
jgi:branched-chain amino acid transport system permease protein